VYLGFFNWERGGFGIEKDHVRIYPSPYPSEKAHGR